jgi:hypothetical protein
MNYAALIREIRVPELRSGNLSPISNGDNMVRRLPPSMITTTALSLASPNQ